MSGIKYMEEGRCIACGRELTEENNVAGVCTSCTSPERLEERINKFPEPMRSTMLRAGRNFGLLPRRD